VTGLVVLGSGGHTSEMMRLLTSVDASSFQVLHVVVAEHDILSSLQFDRLKTLGFKSQLHTIRRSREVGQSFVSAVPTTLVSLFDSLSIITRVRPSLIIVNGPGTCLPISLVGKFISSSIIVFVESVCRVNTLSLTGRLLYFVSDHFLVQWPELQVKYPRSQYLGLLL
jgi:beta-1,4-N-acetylglucosaminyltransferase